MQTLRSHKHLQATQANAQTKACMRRVCLTNENPQKDIKIYFNLNVRFFLGKTT